ncbi:MAG: mechanosensitive ion channel [Bacteriovoracaceae bacterium]|nr:mechanosensitive ion channel [Bacteriovoracaceae bacterium]
MVLNLKELFIQNTIGFHFIISLGLLILGFIALLISKKIVLTSIKKFVGKTKVTWDDVFYQNNLFKHLSYILPVALIYFLLTLMPSLHPKFVQAVLKILTVIVTAFATLSLLSIITSINVIYASHPEFKDRPIKGYFQLIKLIIVIICLIIIVSILLNMSPLVFLSSLGALTAVLILVFKDTIMSLIASILLTSNDLVRIGDWIEMPQFGADGDVIDIALHTIKIQNFDKTITTIPTNKLIDGSFKNWHGMSQFGARRIKRCIYLDLNHFKFLTEKDIQRLGQFKLLKNYLDEISKQISGLDEKSGEVTIDHTFSGNNRRLTNVGTFRWYLYFYLKNNPQISKDATFLIRQLAPTPNGLPLELYIFASETDWIKYENIQADIFDHILTIVPDFGLKLFQNPSGADFGHIAH